MAYLLPMDRVSKPLDDLELSLTLKQYFTGGLLQADEYQMNDLLMEVPIAQPYVRLPAQS